jgi:dihydroorotate dehydrogenase (fumarate)
MIDLTKTIDLSTTYLGLKLKNPLVASSSPMCRKVSNVRRLEDAGASAVILHSLFEEQIDIDSDELDRYITEGSDLSAESTASTPRLACHSDRPSHRSTSSSANRRKIPSFQPQ